MATTHCFGNCFVLGVPGTFANASVSVDEAGTVTAHPIGMTASGTDAGVDPVEDTPQVEEQAVVVEEAPSVQTSMGG